MLTDLRSEELPRELSCDVCIIGAGAAGITIAAELAGSDLKVIILESGGLEPDSAIQALNAGTSSGANRLPLDTTRLRYLGGTTNHWTGLIAPLNAFDFDRNHITDVAGWPVSSKEMASYYKRALALIGHPGSVFDQSLNALLGRCSLPLDNTKLAQTFLHYSDALRFGEEFGQTLRNAANIHVLLNATATRLEADSKGAVVQKAEARSLGGHAVKVKARSFILACGAIENARVLMNFKRDNPDAAMDPGGLAGRYLIDHPTAFCGTVVQTGNHRMQDVLGDFSVSGKKYRPVLSLPPSALSTAQLPNASCFLWAQTADTGVRELLSRALDDLAGSRASHQRQLASLAREIDQPAADHMPGCGQGAADVREPVKIKAVIEQKPSYANRVALGEKVDPFGIPQPHIEWRLGEWELRSLRILLMNLGGELGRLAAGRVRIADWLLTDAPSLDAHMQDYNHPMGCTRMAKAPNEGVVDQQCRVFGTQNLYVAGASTFSTGGIHNPTLTIIALAIRLAEFIGKTSK